MHTDTVIPKWNTTSGVLQEHSTLQRQFARPHGWLGKLVGWWMARANDSFNQTAIRALRVRRGDSILEIGFGPGHAIARLAERTHAAFIAGVDPSEVMQRQATARNQRSIWAGRVTLAQGEVENLPFEDCQFNKAFAVRNLLVWQDPARGLSEIRRVLKPGGIVIICQQMAREPARWWDPPGLSAGDLQKSIQLLERCGFGPVRIRRSLIRRRTICLVGYRSSVSTPGSALSNETTPGFEEVTL